MSDKPIRMLSIDDKSLTTSLDRAGYREMGIVVSSAASTAEALDTLKSKPVDIVVINLDYPKAEATAICRQIRHNPQWKEIPIIVTSVQAKAPVHTPVMDAGANLFVEQPIPRPYFIQKLKQLLTKETRSVERLAHEQLASVKILLGREELKLTIGDLSSSGMLISTDREFPLGSSLSMEFTLPGSKKPLRVEGEVVRLVNPSPRHPERLLGVGVRFQEFAGDSQKRLQKYLENANFDSKQMQYYL